MLWPSSVWQKLEEEEEKQKKGGGRPAEGEAKYGGDTEAATAAKSSARARAATLGDSVACEAEVGDHRRLLQAPQSQHTYKLPILCSGVVHVSLHNFDLPLAALCCLSRSG